jgi:hypothetical protein
MIAILTKYLGPTNTRGSRIKAYTDRHSITVSHDYALDGEGVHRKAAQALMDKMGWPNELISGGVAGGYAFVMLPAIEKAKGDK